jgi:ATP-binding cassette subfamily B protein
MFKRKFVKQESLKDCGAACLLMIMRYYGGNYPLERLRDMMQTDKNGTTAYNLIKVAREVGFDAKGYKCTQCSDLKCHSIVHIVINKIYHHFVVIDKIDTKKEIIIIADPAFGYKKYSFTEFNQIWTHIVITLYPIRKIDNINTTKKVITTFYQTIKPYKKIYILLFVLSIIYTIFNIINTFYFKVTIENTSKELSIHILLLIFFLIILIIKTVIDYIRNELLIYINKDIDEKLMSTTFKHLLSLPVQYFTSRMTGDIVSRLNDLSYVRELISKMIIIILVDLILVTGSAITMCFINFNLFLIVIIILFFYAITVVLFNRTIKLLIMKNQEEGSFVSSAFIESIKGINTIKNLCIEKENYQNVMGKYQNLINNDYELNQKYNLIKMIKEYITGGGLLFIIFLGGIYISFGAIEVSEFIVFIFFLTFFLDPMKNIFDIEPILKASINALIRTSEFYEIEEDIIDNKIIEEGSLTFNKVSFAYNHRDKVFDDISFHINSNEKVMIIGTSGCGKSTLAKLIMRHLDIQSKQIMIDNKDVMEYSLNTIRNNVCYVSQYENLFTDSLFNNIKLNRDIDEKEIYKAMHLTFVDDIFSRHNLDYHSYITSFR